MGAGTAVLPESPLFRRTPRHGWSHPLVSKYSRVVQEPHYPEPPAIVRALLAEFVVSRAREAYDAQIRIIHSR